MWDRVQGTLLVVFSYQDFSLVNHIVWLDRAGAAFHGSARVVLLDLKNVLAATTLRVAVKRTLLPVLGLAVIQRLVSGPVVRETIKANVALGLGTKPARTGAKLS